MLRQGQEEMASLKTKHVSFMNAQTLEMEREQAEAMDKYRIDKE